MLPSLRNSKGISLIELTIMLVVIGILTTMAMKTMTTAVEDARRVKTEREMETLAKAIVGDPTLISSSRRADFGYVGDVGAFPPNLTVLVTNPGYSTWNGPYIPAGYTQDLTGYQMDEWGNAYTYTGGLTISSSGYGTPIVKKIADATSDYLLNGYSGSVKDALDSLPGSIRKDSVTVIVSIPDGIGSSLTKTYHPLASGLFRLDSLPVGQHALNIIYAPQSDTLVRTITILPRQQTGSPETYKFSANYFSGGGGGCGSSVVTLRPTGVGTITALSSSGCSANWQCVSEAAADDDGSYVERASNGYASETYAMDNPSSNACPVIKITVFCRARTTLTQGDVMPAIYIGGVEFDGAAQAVASSYADYSTQWTANPATGVAWTWSDISNIEAGIRIRGQNAGHPARCTQVWVEVQY